MTETNPYNASSITVDGAQFSSKRAAARHFNIKPELFAARLSRGWTPEQAAELSAPPDKSQGNVLVIQDRIFHSYREASEHYGIEYRKFINRLNSGWTPEQAVDLTDPPVRTYSATRTRSITVEGTTYDSLYSAAHAHGVDPVLFSSRIHRGWTPEEAAELKPYERKAYSERAGNRIVVDGTEFTSHAAAAEHFGIGYKTFKNRLDQGYTPEQAAGLESKLNSQFIEDNLVIEGVSYTSISAAAKAYGVSKQTFHNRLKQGLSLEACAGIESKEPDYVEVQGQRFSTVKEAAIHYGLKPNTVTTRMRRGKTLEQALGLTPKGS